ncbi:MAG TPA: hypothetical protein DDW85_01545 [Porphyromonadaceae bacterium]|nr:hypothetical protein [Porphyromonadaceae bacterium]
MKSIFTNFTGLLKDGSPFDFLATWKKTFDKASEREVQLFQKTYSDSWFTYNAPQMSLTAEGVMGKYRLRFMATLLGDESPTPQRRSDGFDIWLNEIPRIGHKFFMSANNYRKLQEVYENPRLSDTQKIKAIEKTLKADIQDAYLGCKDVMDFIALNAFSNWGIARFVPEVNNPGGRKFEVDYQMDEANKLIAAKLWNAANSKAGKINIITELAKIISDFKIKGIEFGEILMSQQMYYFIKTDEGIRLMVHGSDKKAKTVSETQLKELLAENGIPPITTITRRMGIDKDGKRSSVNPWNDNMIVFKPAGVIGEIQPAIEDSELMEEENVEYLNAGNGIRISKWRTGESTSQVAGEYTQGSARLLPIVTDINAIVALQVRGFEEKALAPDAEGNEQTYWIKEEYEAA